MHYTAVEPYTRSVGIFRSPMVIFTCTVGDPLCLKFLLGLYWPAVPIVATFHRKRSPVPCSKPSSCLNLFPEILYLATVELNFTLVASNGDK